MLSLRKTHHNIAEDSDMSAASNRVLLKEVSLKLFNTYSSFSGVHTDRGYRLSVLEIANKPFSRTLLSTMTKVGWDERR